MFNRGLKEITSFGPKAQVVFLRTGFKAQLLITHVEEV